MNLPTKASLIVCGIGFVMLAANSWHVLSNVPRDRTVLRTGIAHYYADYFLYTSFIGQGASGKWVMTDNLFTNEPTKPTWIYWIYTVIGKLGYLGISPFAAYNASILVFGGLLLWVWWHIVKTSGFTATIAKVTAFLFLVTASNIGSLGSFWFSPTPALNRLGGVPHQIFQTIVLLVSALLFAQAVDRTGRRVRLTLMALPVVSFIAAAANPMQMLLMVIAAAVTYIWRRGASISGATVVPLLLLAVPALMGALITNAAFDAHPILTAAKQWENAQAVSVTPWQFLLAVGPVALLLPFGVRGVLRGTTIMRMLAVAGALSVAAFFSPVPALTHTSPVRWLSPATYAAIPLAAAFGAWAVAVSVSAMSRKRVPAYAVTGALLVVYTFLTVPSIMGQVEARSVPLATDRTLILLNAIPSDAVRVMSVIRSHPGNGVVLTDPVLPYDVAVPALTGKRTFTGHPIHTLYAGTKDGLRRTFFEGAMREADAHAFMADHGITYVIASQGAVKTLPKYPFLHMAFANAAATVYTVEP